MGGNRVAVLREREFRRFFIGQAASLLGDGFVNVAIAFAVLELTGSVADVGFVFAARTAFLAVFLLIGGVVADRLPRRAVMIGSDVVRFGSQGLLAALLLSGHAHLWQLLVLQAVHGTASAFFMPAITGLIPQTVGPEHLQEANALRWSADSAGRVVGPAIAGVLVATIGAGAALAVDSGSFAVSALFLASLRLPPHKVRERQSIVRELAEGWHAFRATTWLLTANVLAAFANMLLFAPFFVLGPAVAKRFLGGAGSWALIVSAFGIGSIAGGALAYRLRPRHPIATGLALVVLFAPPLAALALHAPAWVTAPLAFFAGAELTLGNTLWETTLQNVVPEHLLSRLVAYDWLTALVFQPIGQALIGLVAAEVFGLGETLWFCAGFAIVLGATAATLPVLRQVGAPGAAATEPV